MSKNIRRFFLLFVIAALLAVMLPPVRTARAAGFTVNSLADNNTAGDGACTLREAIETANNVGNGDCGPNSAADDVITFSFSGTITLGAQLPAIVSGQGALTINGGGNITISGNNSVRVFTVNNGASLTLQNLTVANGSAPPAGGLFNSSNGTVTIINSAFSGNSATGGSGGGAIFNASDGTLTITNSAFSGNSAAGISGGGIFNSVDAAVTISNSTFSGNSAADGGGIHNYGTLTVSGGTFSGNSATRRGGGIVTNAGGNITDSTFSNNTAGGSGAFDGGGAIHTGNDLTVQNSTFTGNQYTGDANGGGAILATGGLIDISGSLFENNSATGDGGGAIAQVSDFGIPTLEITDTTFRSNSVTGNFADGGAINSNGDVTVANSTFSGNAANSSDTFGHGQGGAVAIFNAAAAEFSNVTFTGNSANNNGGAIYFRNDDADFNNVTIASNRADADGNNVGDGGGVFSDSGSWGGAAPQIRNSILAGNTVPSGGPDCAGDISSQGYNLIQTVTGCIITGSTTGNLTGADPILGPLADNGGPTQTRALLTGSPAIDAGDPGASCLSTDQRGTARFDGDYDGVVRCDIGAFEYDIAAPAPTPVPSSGGTAAASLPATGFAMGRITVLPEQPREKTYSSADELTLELPSLNVKAPIVGVLQSENGWDVTWLGSSVGWLEGSAFPTWQGNTVLTAHVWNADNTPGIFAGIRNLKYGDRFKIHVWGLEYTYEVRENRWLWGWSSAAAVFQHEEYDWVTLLTCEGYNPLTGSYFFRRMVRAVLVSIE